MLLPVAACAGLGIALSACPARPPEPPTIVIAVPVATAVAETKTVAEPAAVVCPPEMIHIAGGVMIRDRKKVQIRDYCIDRYEVTAREYQTCAEHGGCDDADLECDEAWTYGKPELARHPMTCVSWQQAHDFCREGLKRLPTFDEWEWAAQGRGEKRRFAWGSEEPEEGWMCWSKGSKRTGTCPVGDFPRSRTAQGVDDMFGNVWEWLSPPERDGVPNVARGGSWHNDTIDTLEGDNAGGFTGGFVRNDVVGFRCVYDGTSGDPASPAEDSEGNRP